MRLLFAALLFSSAACAAETRIDVILWFDTEDYLLPADDDATKRLCEMLTERKIRATFKLVGEKARVLEQRKRTDVIDALRKHDIGYHSDFHSVHPTPSEYLAECGFLDGVQEFAAREKNGAADVMRILGVPTLSCYGQPGSSWGSQAIAALPQIGVMPHGIPCYVDEGSHIGLDNKPFWYENALVVYKMGPNVTRMDLHDPAALETGKQKVSAIAERLSNDGGGLISIFYHPCEWVHREFWDGVNFKRGANPPRALWRAPGQRTAEETDAAFKRFGEYIDHIRGLKGVRFVTATDLPEIYPDVVRKNGATRETLAKIADKILENPGKLDFQVIDGAAYSLTDQFELLSEAVFKLANGKMPQNPITPNGLFGPDSIQPANSELADIPWQTFQNIVRDVQNLTRQGRMPARIFIGADTVSPGSFLITLAAQFKRASTNGKLTEERVRIPPAPAIAPEDHVAKDTPNLFGGWIIHKENFRAPKILEVARSQTWTLKPAIRGK